MLRIRGCNVSLGARDAFVIVGRHTYRLASRDAIMPRVLPLFAKRPKACKQAPTPGPSETQIQIAVIDHLRYGAANGWKYWHTPNGGLRDKREAAKLRAMGVLPGVPDLVLISPQGKFHGLELKRKGGTLSEEQRLFHAFAKGMGWPVAEADTLDGALDVLRMWGALKRTYSFNTDPAA
jgi:cellobiose-specific phosphotransferase system component IIB